MLVVPFFAQALSVTPIRLELSGDPGNTLSSEFKVYNDSTQAQTFYTQAQNFEAADESGNPKFVNTTDGLASWITMVPSVTAGPKQEVSIGFRIDIPKDAEPGGYFAGLFASTTPPSGDNANIALGSRIGTLLFFRVNGDIPEGVNVVEFSSASHSRFFSKLPISFYFRFQNSGADRIKPLGDVIIKNVFGITTKILNANQVDGNVLPKSIRRFDTAWVTAGGDTKQDPFTELPQAKKLGFFSAAKAELTNFAFGPYTAHLNLAYGNTTAKSATSTFIFFVFPWQLLIIVLIFLIIFLFFFRIFIRRYNRYIVARSKPRRKKM